VEGAAGAGDGVDSVGAVAALGASEIEGALSDGGAVEATAGDIAGGCAFVGRAPSQAASAKGMSQREREDSRPRSGAVASGEAGRFLRHPSASLIPSLKPLPQRIIGARHGPFNRSEATSGVGQVVAWG
jgi:hypothetical protein